jgi:hypothetical protein
MAFALGAAAMMLHMAPALSARPPNVVSGSVTSVQARSIVVNGHSYDVQLQGGALRQLSQIHVGDRVELVLTGRNGAASTQVSAIHVHNAH